AEQRIACAKAQDEAAEVAEALAWANARAARNAAQAKAGRDTKRATAPRPGGTSTQANEAGAQDGSSGCPCGERDGGAPGPGGYNDDDDEPDAPADGCDDNGGGPGPRGPDNGNPGSRPDMPTGGRTFQPRPPDLIVPLLTLLGLAERPGEIQGF